MTDRELANYLGIDKYPSWTRIIAQMTPLRRMTYERMASVDLEIDLWQQGLGPRPEGVHIDMPKARRRI